LSIANARPKATGKLRLAAGALVLVLLHLAAVVQLVGTEPDLVSKVASVLAWLLLNCF